MERAIDQHEVRRPARSAHATTILTKMNRWRTAWSACYQLVEDWPNCDPKRFHPIFEKWVPILNWIFEKPISNLERYDALFYYCNEPNGPKEIIQLYMDDNPLEDDTVVHIVFNVYEFTLIHKQYCLNMCKNNQMLFNEARGTINLVSCQEYDTNPAEYFQTMTYWQLLFVHTLHALAHWDTYDAYEHAHYDTHFHIRDSPFFKLHFFGRIVYRNK